MEEMLKQIEEELLALRNRVYKEADDSDEWDMGEWAEGYFEGIVFVVEDIEQGILKKVQEKIKSLDSE